MTLNGGIIRARRSKRRIVEPRANQIQLDLDGLAAIDTFCRQRAMLRAHGLTRRWHWTMTASAQRSHVHVTVTLPGSRPLIDRVLLAALLGSDLKREAFNYIRTKKRKPLPVVFFESRKGRRHVRLADL